MKYKPTPSSPLYCTLRFAVGFRIYHLTISLRTTLKPKQNAIPKMQRHLLLPLLLLSATSILATPQRKKEPGTQCTDGSYKSCIAAVLCIQSFPESCTCHNDIVTRCAQACGEVASPEDFQDCGEGRPSPPQSSPKPPPKSSPKPPPKSSPKPPPKNDGDDEEGEERCMTHCLEGRFCPVLYPAQCRCRNRHIRACARRCGVEDFEKQLNGCPVTKGLKGKPSWKTDGKRQCKS